MKKVIFIACCLYIQLSSAQYQKDSNRIHFQFNGLLNPFLIDWDAPYYKKQVYNQAEIQQLLNLSNYKYSNAMIEHDLNQLSNYHQTPFEKYNPYEIYGFGMFDPIRSQFLADKKYSHQKLKFGSYKDFIPDNKYYEMMEAMFHHHYTEYKAAPDSLRILALDSFYKFHTKFLSGMNNFKYSAEFHYMGEPPTVYMNYQNPRFYTNEDVLVLKSGYKDLAKLVLIDRAGKERKLMNADHFADAYYSYRNKKVYFSSVYKKYNGVTGADIIHYDMVKHQSHTITQHGNYHYPIISENGFSLAAIRPGKNHDALCLIDPNTGQLEKIVDSQYFFSHPQFSYDGNDIFVIASDTQFRTCILQITIKTNTVKNITPWIHHQIKNMSLTRNLLYFDANFSGIQNIYCYNIPQRKLFQVTNRMTGNYQAAANDLEDKLMFTEYTHVGTNLMVVNVLEISQWFLIEKINDITELRPPYSSWIPSINSIVKHIQKTTLPNKTNHKITVNRFGFDVYQTMGKLNWDYITNKNTFISNSLLYSNFERSIILQTRFNKRVSNQIFYFDHQLLMNRILPSGLNVGLSQDFGFGISLHPLKHQKGWYTQQLFNADLRLMLNSLFVSPYIHLKYRYQVNTKTPAAGILPNRSIAIQMQVDQHLYNLQSMRRINTFVEGTYSMPFLSTHIANIRLGYFHDIQQKGVGFLYDTYLARGIFNSPSRDNLYINFSYNFPIVFPDYTLKDILYVKSVRGAVYSDYFKGTVTSGLNSGIEIMSEVFLFETFKLNIGLRLGYQQSMFGLFPVSKGWSIRPYLPNSSITL